MKLKRSFLVLLLFLTLSVVLTTYMRDDTGYVRISFQNYLLETSLWFATVSTIILIGLITILFGLGRRLFSSSKWIGEWVSQRGLESARKQTTKGLLAYAEGNWRQAQRFLTSSAEKTDTPLINYLAAAQAAHEQGNEKDSDHLLRQAYESTPGADMAVGITKAQLLIASHQYEQCLATLVRLRKKSPNHPFLLKLLKTAYENLEDWNKITETMHAFRKAKIASTDELNELEQKSWIALLDSAAEEIMRTTGSSTNTDAIDVIWDKLPGTMRKNEKVIHTYTHHLKLLGESQRAEALLRKVLHHQWSPSLVHLYGQLDVTEPSELLITAENWLKSRPNDDELLLTLGRLSLKNQLWIKAREYFEASLKLKKRPETFAELCRLYSHLGETQLCNDSFNAGLIEEIGLQDLPMPTLVAANT